MDETHLLRDTLLFTFFTALFLLELSCCSLLDISALQAIKAGIVDPSGALNNWTGNNSCDTWTGISCGSSGRVQSIELGALNLTGELSPHIGNLSFLLHLNLSSNRFLGNIPSELGNCVNLQYFDLKNNYFSGPIAAEIFDLGDLREIDLSNNKLEGSISSKIGSLRKLQDLNLSSNFLSGRIPVELGNCSELHTLDISNTILTGEIPPAIFQLKQLTQLSLYNDRVVGKLELPLNSSFSVLSVLDIHSNQLSGNIYSLSHLSQLEELNLSDNDFEGEIPSSFGNLTRLQLLVLSDNLLSGMIPPEIGNLIKLQQLDLGSNIQFGPIPGEIGLCQGLLSLDLRHNKLSDEIPSEIGNLSSLNALVLSNNSLVGSIPSELAQCVLLKILDLSNNFLTGAIPKELTQVVNLTNILLDHNYLSGTIPIGFGSMTRLEYLGLSYNLLWGSIPDNFVQESPLLSLVLSYNSLTGRIPISLQNLVYLSTLDLSWNDLSGPFNITCAKLLVLSLDGNQLSGSLPEALWTLTQLLTLSLTHNMLSGKISQRVQMLRLIETLELSHNNLTGEIPCSIGELSYLNTLDVSSNNLSNAIPTGLENCNSLTNLNLSNNNLTGPIPSFEKFPSLKFIDVSYNNLRGPIPLKFYNSNAVFFEGNPELCGNPLPAVCSTPVVVSPWPGGEVLRILAVCASLTATMLVLACALLYRTCLRRRLLSSGNRSSADAIVPNMKVSFYLRNWLSYLHTSGFRKDERMRVPIILTFDDLLVATGDFSPDNVVGDGGFGNVYKGVLDCGTVIAVKKLTEDGYQGEREFTAEMETLGGIQHKNLVRLLGHCVAGLERLLVYEYMPNNSLDVWLHNRTEGMEPLPWAVRLTIAQDVARGLTFLHHFHVPHIIHRDLKSSNILLDKNFNARISDFGLARLMNTYDSHVSTTIAGSLGYIAPEYASSWRVTTRGDVFSFGVVLLELLSGKRPAGAVYKPLNGGNLAGWLRHLQQANQVPVFFDAELCPEGYEEKLMMALDVAIRCTQENPCKRPRMLDILRYLESIA